MVIGNVMETYELTGIERGTKKVAKREHLLTGIERGTLKMMERGKM